MICESNEPAPVLWVDDRPDAAGPLSDGVDARWCRLVVARSSYEAVLALLREDFAAIVIDVRIPDLLGFELAALIKGLQRTRDVPMLFMTSGDLDERDVLRGYEIGAVDYIHKPLNPKILRVKLAAFCELFQKSRALERATSGSRPSAEPTGADPPRRPLTGSLL
jgi:DNA-binding response OmpR family regulator